MNRIILSLIALSFACGAPVEDEPADLGQTSQGLMFAPSGAMQPGIRPGSESSCVQGDHNQNCVIPRVKALRFYMYGPTGAAMNTIRSQVNAWYTDMVAKGLSQASDGWAFSEATDLGDEDITLIIDVNTGGSFCSGPDTKGLSCFTGSTTGLQTFFLFGTYHTWQEGTVPVLHIDTGEISGLSGHTSAQKANLLHQAVWSGLDRFGGIGLMATGDSRCNLSTRLPNVTCVNRTQQACFFNGFGDGGNTDSVWIGGANCGT